VANGFVIRKNQYYDSMFLMVVNKRLSDSPGVQQTAVLMGTEKNKELLVDIGIQHPQIEAAHADDLIVAVIAETPEIVEAVLARIDQTLNAVIETSPPSDLHTFEDGMAQKPGANLAVISIPGEYAASEARNALQAGLNVFLFSDNVSIEDELALKQLAAQKGLLVMGPDCGTSLIGGIGIGFANAVRKGPIGVVGAAGTGLQEFTSQVHNAGSGISHAIGTGSHDLSDKIAGLTTFAALDALEADPQTQIIAVISKPPGGQTLTRLIERLRVCRKPVVCCLLGTDSQKLLALDVGRAKKSSSKRAEPVEAADTIDEAVRLALARAGGQTIPPPARLNAPELELAAKEKARWLPEQKYLRGLFAGGTFCYQSQQILCKAGIPAYSNSPFDPQFKLAHPAHSFQHSLVDMGDDTFTVGKPHPMIDGTLRKQRILAEANDPQVAILLLDFILGNNAAQNPVGELLDAIRAAKQLVHQRGGTLTVVASICGTDGDAQNLGLQTQMLLGAGVLVFQSNAAAAAFCCELLEDR
jgi:succinyl-CoA synthetase alpha subunit